MEVEEKLILDVLHIKVMCVLCKGFCWTQPMSKLAMKVYRCHTCTEPKLVGYGRGDDRCDTVRSSS
jgi:hypothetical protein